MRSITCALSQAIQVSAQRSLETRSKPEPSIGHSRGLRTTSHHNSSPTYSLPSPFSPYLSIPDELSDEDSSDESVEVDLSLTKGVAAVSAEGAGSKSKGSKPVPRAIALVGATGIGKTHLLMHGRELCDAKGVPVHVASAPSVDRDQKYLVWKALLGPLFRSLAVHMCARCLTPIIYLTVLPPLPLQFVQSRCSISPITMGAPR